jgi:NADP-dependent 3-hydroxy acid dehydrogenase YdfG
MAEPKVALISGAAGGIGGATARKFAAEGWRVLLTDREDERLAATSRDIPGARFSPATSARVRPVSIS